MKLILKSKITSGHGGQDEHAACTYSVPLWCELRSPYFVPAGIHINIAKFLHAEWISSRFQINAIISRNSTRLSVPVLPRVFAKSALLFVVYTGMNYDAYAIWFPEGLKWLVNNIATRVEIRTITSYRDKYNLYRVKTAFLPNYVVHNAKINSLLFAHSYPDVFIFRIDD